MVFTVSEKRPVREGMTVSRNAGLGSVNGVTWFSMGKGTSISQESYDTPALYLGAAGEADFLIGESPAAETTLKAGDFLYIPGRTLCGAESRQGAIYTEIILSKEIAMNNAVTARKAMKLKDLIAYEKGSITNMDIVKNDTMKFVLMAFDEGTGLSSHRAPGNAIITALEGKAVIGYEGEDYALAEGESFRFEKNGLHSVKADGRFKMSLLLVLE